MTCKAKRKAGVKSLLICLISGLFLSGVCLRARHSSQDGHDISPVSNIRYKSPAEQGTGYDTVFTECHT